MSLRLEMLQVARLAPKLLGDSTGLVRAFFARQFSADGGAHDRAGRPDLYYTIFALAGLQALTSDLSTLNSQLSTSSTWLRTFGDGAGLGFIHLGALARCWAAVGLEKMPAGLAAPLLARIEGFRARDGGYDGDPAAAHGNAYGCFVALGAYQDLRAAPGAQISKSAVSRISQSADATPGEPAAGWETGDTADLEVCATAPPAPLRMVQCLKFLETPDGAWANARGLRVGSTNATAAAVTLLHQLGVPVHATVGDWLLAQAHPDGGFRAMPAAPLPDLLSTATTLHALACLEKPVPEPIRERCLDFIDTLWNAAGGFHGHWADDDLDPEYTFYGLLALGHLSLG